MKYAINGMRHLVALGTTFGAALLRNVGGEWVATRRLQAYFPELGALTRPLYEHTP